MGALDEVVDEGVDEESTTLSDTDSINDEEDVLELLVKKYIHDEHIQHMISITMNTIIIFLVSGFFIYILIIF